MTVFTEPFSVRWCELASDGRLQISALLGYLEHAAGRHADSLGVSVGDLADRGLTWVLARMRLDSARWPGGNEPLVVQTWAAGIQRRLFRRDYRIITGDGTPLVTATTTWVPLDIVSRKPGDFPQSLIDRIPIMTDGSPPDADRRIPALKNGQAGPLFPVRQADIDRNGHVNNGRYLDFLLETASLAGYGDARPGGIDITFRSESVYGDTVTAASEREDAAAVRISLYRRRDERELVRARLIYR